MISFTMNFLTKLILACTITFGFLLIMYIFSIYFIYKFSYNNLSKYFLDSVYRLDSSFILVTIIYGYRPFLRGCIHALLFSFNNTQLFALAGIEGLTMFSLIFFQQGYGCHKCKIAFSLKAGYHFLFLILNLVFVLEKLTHNNNLSDWLIYILLGTTFLQIIALIIFECHPCDRKNM